MARFLLLAIASVFLQCTSTKINVFQQRIEPMGLVEKDATSLDCLGCYKDTLSPRRDLSGYSWNSASMSVEKCAAGCVLLDYPYSGVQGGTYCFCGASYGSYGQADSTVCNAKCAGNSNQICGGTWANSVYRTDSCATKPSGYMGCFVDSASTHDLSGPTVGTVMTLQYCAAVCVNMDFTYFGVQSGSTCYCGNSYGAYGASQSCTSVCTGDNSQWCGGPSANSVYRSGSLATKPADSIGCYKDAADRDLNGKLVSSTTATVEWCASQCTDYAYYGLQAGSACLCGNSYGKYGKSDQCFFKCAGNSSQICGNYWVNNVYRNPNYVPPTTTTAPPPTTTTPVPTTTTLAPTTTSAPVTTSHHAPVLIGCYKDKGSARDLKAKKYVGHDVTVELCASLCAGYTYMAVQCGDHCFCDNQYGLYGSLPLGTCAWPCNGNPNEICGGRFANSVYQLPAASTYVEEASFGLQHL